MSLSRRGLLTGVAGLAATAATGGGATAARAAMAGTGALAAAAGAAAGPGDRIGRVFEALGRHPGGYPHRLLRDLRLALSIDFVDDPRGEGEMAAMQERLRGGGNWARCPVTEKISCSREIELHRLLKRLPCDMPLMDLLDDQVFAGLDNGGDPHDYNFLRGHGFFRAQDVARLREVLAPLCDSATTSRDLITGLEGFFRRLAEHAAENPSDVSGAEWDIRALSEIIRESNSGKNANDSLLKRLERARERLNEEARRKQDEINRRCKAQENERKQEEIALGCRQEVRLYPAGQGRFVLTPPDGRPLPARADWLRWVQALDPRNAYAKDIELDHLGMTVAFGNAAALDFLQQQEKSGVDGAIVLKLRIKKFETPHYIMK